MNKNSIYEMFLSLLLITLFVITSFMVILYGANAYGEMVSRHNHEQKYRVAFDYIKGRVLDGDDYHVSDNKLIIEHDAYQIIIYHDQTLKEMVVKKGYEFEDFGGEEIEKIDSLKLEETQKGLKIEIDGKKMELLSYEK